MVSCCSQARVEGFAAGDLAGGTLSLGGGMCEFDVDDFCIST